MRRRKDTGPDLFTLRCEVCNRYLVRTQGGFLTCPEGHGRLQLDAGALTAPVEEPTTPLFDTDTTSGRE